MACYIFTIIPHTVALNFVLQSIQHVLTTSATLEASYETRQFTRSK